MKIIDKFQDKINVPLSGYDRMIIDLRQFFAFEFLATALDKTGSTPTRLHLLQFLAEFNLPNYV